MTLVSEKFLLVILRLTLTTALPQHIPVRQRVPQAPTGVRAQIRHIAAAPTKIEDPAHAADRHLEAAEALVRLVRSVAEDAADERWPDLRQGLVALSSRIEQHLADAREALDEA